MQAEIERLRSLINDLDEQLIRLLNERAKAAVEISKYKAEAGADLYDPDRERQVLKRLEALNTGPLGTGAIDEVFNSIITVCREIQNR